MLRRDQMKIAIITIAALAVVAVNGTAKAKSHHETVYSSIPLQFSGPQTHSYVYATSHRNEVSGFQSQPQHGSGNHHYDGEPEYLVREIKANPLHPAPAPQQQHYTPASSSYKPAETPFTRQSYILEPSYLLKPFRAQGLNVYHPQYHPLMNTPNSHYETQHYHPFHHPIGFEPQPYQGYHLGPQVAYQHPRTPAYHPAALHSSAALLYNTQAIAPTVVTRTVTATQVAETAAAVPNHAILNLNDLISNDPNEVGKRYVTQSAGENKAPAAVYDAKPATDGVAYDKPKLADLVYTVPKSVGDALIAGKYPKFDTESAEKTSTENGVAEQEKYKNQSKEKDGATVADKAYKTSGDKPNKNKESGETYQVTEISPEEEKPEKKTSSSEKMAADDSAEVTAVEDVTESQKAAEKEEEKPEKEASGKEETADEKATENIKEGSDESGETKDESSSSKKKVVDQQVKDAESYGGSADVQEPVVDDDEEEIKTEATPSSGNEVSETPYNANYANADAYESAPVVSSSSTAQDQSADSKEVATESYSAESVSDVTDYKTSSYAKEPIIIKAVMMEDKETVTQNYSEENVDAVKFVPATSYETSSKAYYEDTKKDEVVSYVTPYESESTYNQKDEESAAEYETKKYNSQEDKSYVKEVAYDKVEEPKEVTYVKEVTYDKVEEPYVKEVAYEKVEEPKVTYDKVEEPYVKEVAYEKVEEPKEVTYVKEAEPEVVAAEAEVVVVDEVKKYDAIQQVDLKYEAPAAAVEIYSEAKSQVYDAKPVEDAIVDINLDEVVPVISTEKTKPEAVEVISEIPKLVDIVFYEDAQQKAKAVEQQVVQDVAVESLSYSETASEVDVPVTDAPAPHYVEQAASEEVITVVKGPVKKLPEIIVSGSYATEKMYTASADAPQIYTTTPTIVYEKEVTVSYTPTAYLVEADDNQDAAVPEVKVEEASVKVEEPVIETVKTEEVKVESVAKTEDVYEPTVKTEEVKVEETKTDDYVVPIKIEEPVEVVKTEEVKVEETKTDDYVAPIKVEETKTDDYVAPVEKVVVITENVDQKIEEPIEAVKIEEPVEVVKTENIYDKPIEVVKTEEVKVEETKTDDYVKPVEIEEVKIEPIAVEKEVIKAEDSIKTDDSYINPKTKWVAYVKEAVKTLGNANDNYDHKETVIPVSYVKEESYQKEEVPSAPSASYEEKQDKAEDASPIATSTSAEAYSKKDEVSYDKVETPAVTSYSSQEVTSESYKKDDISYDKVETPAAPVITTSYSSQEVTSESSKKDEETPAVTSYSSQEVTKQKEPVKSESYQSKVEEETSTNVYSTSSEVSYAKVDVINETLTNHSKIVHLKVESTEDVSVEGVLTLVINRDEDKNGTTTASYDSTSAGVETSSPYTANDSSEKYLLVTKAKVAPSPTTSAEVGLLHQHHPACPIALAAAKAAAEKAEAEKKMAAKKVEEAEVEKEMAEKKVEEAEDKKEMADKKVEEAEKMVKIVASKHTPQFLYSTAALAHLPLEDSRESSRETATTAILVDLQTSTPAYVPTTTAPTIPQTRKYTPNRTTSRYYSSRPVAAAAAAPQLAPSKPLTTPPLVVIGKPTEVRKPINGKLYTRTSSVPEVRPSTLPQVKILPSRLRIPSATVSRGKAQQQQQVQRRYVGRPPVTYE